MTLAGDSKLYTAGMAPYPTDWETLPEDIWLMIFEFLSQKEHYQLNLVSYHIHRFSLPALYSQFVWVPEIHTLPLLHKLEGKDLRILAKRRRRTRAKLSNVHCSPPKPFLLLRTLLNHPDLATHFRHVNILSPPDNLGIFFSEHDAQDGCFSMPEFEQAERSILHTPYLCHNIWIDGLRKGKLDVVVGLLISQLSSLKDIKISTPSEEATVWSPLMEVFASSKCNSVLKLSKFPSLESAILQLCEPGKEYDDLQLAHYYWNGKNVFNLEQEVDSLLALPKIRSISLFPCSPKPNWDNRPLPIANYLKSATLKYGSMNERLLNTFIDSTPFLEELNCDLTWSCPTVPIFDGPALNKSLSRLSKSLKHLRLNLVVIDDEYPWDIVEPLGSLKHFKNLRYLATNIITLFDKDFANYDQDDLTEGQADYMEAILPDGLDIESFVPLDRGEMSDVDHARYRAAEYQLIRWFRSRGGSYRSAR